MGLVGDNMILFLFLMEHTAEEIKSVNWVQAE